MDVPPSTRRRKVRDMRDKHWRAVNHAMRYFKLEVYVHAGKTTVIDEKLLGFIREHIALAWVKGYDAARREGGAG